MSFIPQALHGIELGRATGGNGSENNTHQGRNGDRYHGGKTVNRDVIGGEEADGEGDGDSNDA